MRPTRSETLRLAAIAILFLAAPTAGDIGGCSQTATDLDANKFFIAKQEVDCRRCNECALTTQACIVACGALMPGAFPEGCYPVVHDGEVCLGALEAAGCEDYRRFVADEGSVVPTECDFCPARGVITDAGADQ